MLMTESAELTTQFVAPDLFSIQAHEDAIEAGIIAGHLPQDTYFRLRAIGQCQTDWKDGRNRLAFNIAEDIAKNTQHPDQMRSDTQTLLWGERPDAVIDWEQTLHKDAYSTLDVMYYRMANLARVIKRQRQEENRTIKEVPDDWYISPERFEQKRCFGLARPIWRVIVQRIHPEWLAQPDSYCQRTVYGIWGSRNELSDQTMRRYIVGAAVISDEVVLNIYDESKRIGVKGIGPKGREALRELLSDEHPELY